MSLLLRPGRCSKYCDKYVCLSGCLFVFLSTHISHKPSRLNFTKFSAPVACGRGSVFLRRRCDRLFTSGFVDVVMIVGNMAPYVYCIDGIGEVVDAERAFSIRTKESRTAR